MKNLRRRNLHQNLHRAGSRIPDGEAGERGVDDAISNTVFFSWQSDLNETRNIIRDALSRAVRNQNRVVALEEALRVDDDTADVAGWPEITSTILEKIEHCEVFIADITTGQWPRVRLQAHTKPERNVRAGVRPGNRFGQNADHMRRKRGVSSHGATSKNCPSMCVVVAPFSSCWKTKRVAALRKDRKTRCEPTSGRTWREDSKVPWARRSTPFKRNERARYFTLLLT